MATEVKAPVLPESVADGTIATWHKKVGDAVKRDENLLDLETDKVVLEVPSPVDGVLKEIKFEVGATVTSSQVVAVIEEGAAAAARLRLLLKPSRPLLRRPLPLLRPLLPRRPRRRSPLPMPCPRARASAPSPKA